jgi:hypothetical protein
MNKSYIVKSALTLILSIIFILYSIEVFANPGGRTGRTRKSGTTGCGGGCHSSSTAISGAITGPSTVFAGQTYTFTLTINMASGSGGEGVDIAVKNGTLAVIAGSGLKLSSGELTHSSAISYSNPKVIQFSYTAPGTAGTDTLYATVDRGYSGAWAFTPNYGFTVESLSGVINNETPVSFGLAQNFPNPFNPVTKINYRIEKSGIVTLKVYDVTGNEISTLVSSNQTAGSYTVDFNSGNLSSGIYFYKLESAGKSDVRKMTLLK